MDQGLWGAVSMPRKLLYCTVLHCTTLETLEQPATAHPSRLHRTEVKKYVRIEVRNLRYSIILENAPKTHTHIRTRNPDFPVFASG